MKEPQKLSKIYEKRFNGFELYRRKVWKVLVSNYFSKWITKNSHILDLGCGYGEFINQIECSFRYAMDLNPKTKDLLDTNIKFIEQDCSKPWSIKPKSLDLVFTSNFFEHLPNKKKLDQTISEIQNSLKSGDYS